MACGMKIKKQPTKIWLHAITNLSGAVGSIPVLMFYSLVEGVCFFGFEKYSFCVTLIQRISCTAHNIDQVVKNPSCNRSITDRTQII